jgi:hypothetical protein
MEVVTNMVVAMSNSFVVPTVVNAVPRTRQSRDFWLGTLLNKLQSEMFRKLVSMTNTLFLSCM